jgi:alpha-mannosidase
MPATRRPILHLISQAHLDPVWLWPLHDGVAETLTTLQSAVSRAEETPSFKFTRSSACTYRWAEEMDPALFSKIKSLTVDGRWEVVGGWVEQPDCNLPSTESFIRQALYAKAYFRRALGPAGDTRIGYNVDSFGHAGGLPQILQATGFDRYVFMRPQPHDDPSLPLLFWWKSPDGARVLAQRIPVQYSQSYAATPSDIEATVRASAAECFAPGFQNGAMWFGVGNHGGGPTRAHIQKILELQDDPSLPELRFSTLRDYFAAVESESAFKRLPTIDRELNFLLRGCYSSTGWVKQLHRANEKALFAAESLACLAHGTQADPATLHDAWWEHLFNEFHDILAGTCVAATDAETRDRHGATRAAAQAAARRAAFTVARRVDTSAEPGSVLFAANPLPWARTAVVTFDTFKTPHGQTDITHLESQDGSERFPIQWQHADANLGPWGLPWGKFTAAIPLPACGHRVFRVATCPAAKAFVNPFAGEAATEQFIKTEAEATSSATLSHEPSLPSFKLGRRELLAAPLGLVAIRDTSGAWGHNIAAFDEELGRPESLGLETLADGPVLTHTRETLRWGASEIWLDLIWHSHHPAAVEVCLRINWQEKRQMLKLELPTRLKKTSVRAKMAGEIAQRSSDGQEAPCHDWVALDGTLGGRPATLAVLNDATYAYDAKAGRLRLTLVRAVPAAEHPPFEYTDDRHVHFLDQGWQERRFLLIATDPAEAEISLDRLAEEFQVPAIHMLDSAHPGDQPWQASLVAVAPSNVAVLALKPAENQDGLILRVQELSGRATKAQISIQNSKSPLRVALKPWQIKTLLLRQGARNWTCTETEALEA